MVIGGIAETQEVIDYCAARNIKADIELIRPEEINRVAQNRLRNLRKEEKQCKSANSETAIWKY